MEVKKLILLWIALLFLYPPALGSQIIEVEIRRGHTLHGFADIYLKDPSKWPKIFQLNKDRIKDPDMIYPGQIIRVPVEMLRGEVGDLTRVVRRVEIKRKDEADWETASKGLRLFPEDGIMTGSKSRADVDFLVGGDLSVSENSLIYLRPTKERSAAASLLGGGLRAREAPVITPSAEINPERGSKYDVELDEHNTTRVSVRLGEVDVRAMGTTVTVAGGYRTLVSSGGVPELPVSLPGSGEKSIQSGNEMTPPEGYSYRLQISVQEDFSKTVKEEDVRELKLQTIMEGLESGKYYWRAALVDEQGFIGDFSRPRVFYRGTHERATLELTGFEVINKQEGVMRVTGISQRAGNVNINGYPAEVAKDGSFTATIILGPEFEDITVTALGPAGMVMKRYRRDEDGLWKPAR